MNKLNLMSLLILISAQLASASDAISFGYTPNIDGIKYESLAPLGSKVLLNRGDIYLINKPGSTTEPVFSTKPLPAVNQTLTLNMSATTTGIISLSLNASSYPTGYFISIDGVPTHAQKFIPNKPLNFMFSSELFSIKKSRSLRLDILEFSNKWTIVQSIPFVLTTSASGYIPPNSTTWSRYDKGLVINPSTFKTANNGNVSDYGYNAADPCVMFDKKTNKFHAYFSSVILSTDKQVIKHAESADGATWFVKDQIALNVGATGAWDSKSVETCSVHSVETSPGVFKYYLFYSASATTAGNDTDIYKIGLATSDNPNSFTRLPAAQSSQNAPGLIFEAKDAFSANSSIVKGVVTDPDVIYQNGSFKMWYYCSGQNSNSSYIDGGICYATSTDGIRWSHKGSLPTLLNKATVGVLPQQPTVVYSETKKLYEMWLVINDPAYEGLAVGGYYYATSLDGIKWSYPNGGNLDFKWNPNLLSENHGLITGPEVLEKSGTYYLYYPSFSSQGIPADYYLNYTWGINLATKK